MRWGRHWPAFQGRHSGSSTRLQAKGSWGGWTWAGEESRLRLVAGSPEGPQDSCPAWSPQPGPPSAEDMEEWQVVRGKFLAINAANMCCACPRSPRGLSPAAHVGDGSCDLILIRKCSRLNFLRFLVRHTNQGDQVRGVPGTGATR